MIEPKNLSNSKQFLGSHITVLHINIVLQTEQFYKIKSNEYGKTQPSHITWSVLSLH
jgi:hypothetical protein